MLKEELGKVGFRKIEHLMTQLENMPKNKKGLRLDLNPE